jgi:hypothetical protein
MNLPSNFNPTALGITTVEALSEWCFQVILAGYGPGEFRPNNTSSIAFENTFNDGLDGNKRERHVIALSLVRKQNIAGQSLRTWQTIDAFTANAIPAAFLVAV